MSFAWELQIKSKRFEINLDDNITRNQGKQLVVQPRDAMSGQEIKPYPPAVLTALTTPVALLSVIACKSSVYKAGVE